MSVLASAAGTHNNLFHVDSYRIMTVAVIFMVERRTPTVITCRTSSQLSINMTDIGVNAGCLLENV